MNWKYEFSSDLYSLAFKLVLKTIFVENKSEKFVIIIFYPINVEKSNTKNK